MIIVAEFGSENLLLGTVVVEIDGVIPIADILAIILKRKWSRRYLRLLRSLQIALIPGQQERR